MVCAMGMATNNTRKLNVIQQINIKGKNPNWSYL